MTISKLPKKSASVVKKNGKSAVEVAVTLPSLDNHLFNSLDAESKGYIYFKDLIKALERMGIRTFDPRLIFLKQLLATYSDSTKIDNFKFNELIKHNHTLIESALTGKLIVPDFEGFCRQIKEIYELTLPNRNGAVADYIPQLARVNPEQYAVSICTIDGQMYSLGDYLVPYCLQSTCKPINYCMALKEHGEQKVHEHIGREPSGRGFNELTLNKEGRPHNPLINAGAIMACSLIKPDLPVADRFDYVMDVWTALSGGFRPGFNNAIYLSERQTADRNFALGYFMQEKKAFPKGTNLHDVLEFYFQCCSIEVTAESMATIAATLANSGVCPLTGQRIFEADSIKDCLSLMYSCGMYDFSGEFAFTVGLPAKSGVSGALMIVVPNVMGIAIWSPRLDQLGNSVRGIEFCKEMVKRFNFHNYDSLVTSFDKIDPRLKKHESKLDGVMSLIWAASQGDLNELKRLVAGGVDLNEADYDGRTAIHLAASEGQAHVIQYFIDKKVKLNPKDRWGGTPLADAYRGQHTDVIKILEKHGAKKE